MKKNNFLHLFMLMGLAIISCKNDDETITSLQNQNPEDFSVEATEITDNSALLTWNSAIDPDGDVVSYEIMLNGTEIASSITDTEYLLEELSPNINYNGSVIASDGNNGVFESTFTFTTNETIDTMVSIAWQKSLGGTSNDEAYSIWQTNDQGYIVAGSSESDDGNVSGNNGNKDCWIVKLDSQGTIQWETNIGGSNNDTVHDIKQTTDGGFIVGAFSSSSDGDVSANNGMRDFWIVKLNASGSIEWENNVGGSSDDILESIIQSSDGGYVAVGFSSSDQFDVSGQSDAWVIKLNASGVFQWETNLGGSQRDIAFSVDQTTDQGYIIAGYTETNDNKRDMWIAKLDATGDLSWEKSFVGTENEEAESIEQTSDGGYIIAGYSESNDGDIGENKGGNDAIIIKTDIAGNIQWKQTFGGSRSEGISDIHQTNDGGYIAIGNSSSNDEDVADNNGASDFWIIRLEPNGAIVWQKNLGDEGDDYAFSIQQTSDDGFIATGTWYTNITGSGEGTTGDFDYWVIKLE
ncbi:fibronectin type III domain-containing protein [uncultured Aquimarina sp.]|uniref:fibronectin type III domain-containing protein n=1 Tax=uncultured Aquimarina sp. TaxID=575652 RepID=UPI002619A1B3|nr:fibronectin type III domain-containing protein [uncultured Aquimarina sp.]